MNSGKCKQHILILLCVLMGLTACNNKQQADISAGIAGCDSILLNNYRASRENITEPRPRLKAILAFYRNTPTACRNSIAPLVIDDLFDLVYANPDIDTAVIPNFKNLADDPDLSLDNKTKALFRIGAFHLYSQRDIPEAMKYINKARNNNPKMNDTLAKGYNSLMGQVMTQQTKFQEASEYYMKAVAYCEKLKDSAALAGTYANFGTVFSRMGDHTKAIEMKKKAAAFFETQHNNNNLFIAYIGIAAEFGEMRHYDSAIYYYLTALNLTELGVQNPTAEFDLHVSLAGIYMGKMDFERARFFFGKARETLDVLRDVAHERVYTMASTPAYAGVRNVDAEIAKIKSYIPDYFAEHDISSAKDAYYCLFHTYYIQDKQDLALDNYQTYDSLKSILAAENSKKYIAEMETKYETQKKELKIQVQRKELTQKNVLNGFLLALLGAVIMASAFLITRYRLYKNRKDAALQQQFTRRLIENTEEERVRIARDLHDGVSQELLVLKTQISNNHEHTNDKIDFIINEIRMISRDLHPVMLDKIGLKSSVQHICEQMMESNLLFITADIDYSGGLDKNGELQLFRMIQEALNNIVKYAGAEAAKVTLTHNERCIFAEIVDNGKGFDVQAAMNSKNAFGLLSLMERSKAMNGKTEITSSSAGTIVKIEIPKSNV